MEGIITQGNEDPESAWAQIIYCDCCGQPIGDTVNHPIADCSFCDAPETTEQA